MAGYMFASNNINMDRICVDVTVYLFVPPWRSNLHNAQLALSHRVLHRHVIFSFVRNPGYSQIHYLGILCKKTDLLIFYKWENVVLHSITLAEPI